MLHGTARSWIIVGTCAVLLAGCALTRSHYGYEGIVARSRPAKRALRLEPASPPPQMPAAIPSDYRLALAEALTTRPELLRGRQAVERAAMKLSSARLAYLPTAESSGRVYWDDEDFGYDGDRTNWIAGATLNWSLFEGGSRAARLARARAVLDEMLDADRRTTLAVQLDVKTSYLRLDEARARTEVTRASALQAEETLALVQKQMGAPLEAAAFLLFLILYVGGVFRTGTIPPGKTEAPAGVGEPPFVERVVREKHPIWYEGVGTIRSRTQATVASQVTGRVVEVGAEAGEAVAKGDLLVRLDDQEFKARLEQARSALEAARAEHQQASANLGRIKRLFREDAATKQRLEVAETRAKRTSAGVGAAEQKVTEAAVSLGYTRIQSPIAGVVGKRDVEPGDLAWPGRPLFVIQHQEDLRLEASVREGLIGEVEIGQAVKVHLTALNTTVEGRINEIVPSADPVSRSFLVKVSLPTTEGLYPGMFGKLRIQRGDRFTILIPERAIQRVGQLTTVRVRTDGRWERRYVTVGPTVANRREVLAGLSGGEEIGWD